jgi:hypothetical protein
MNGAQFVTRRIKSAVYSIGANAQHTSTITCPTISGYTPLAVIGFQNNHGNYMFPVAVYMNNRANTVSFTNKNQTSTSFNDAFDLVTVLYAKTGLVDRDESW